MRACCGGGAGGPESLRGATARDGSPEGGADRQGRTPAVGLAGGGIADATQGATGQGDDGAPASPGDDDELEVDSQAVADGELDVCLQPAERKPRVKRRAAGAAFVSIVRTLARGALLPAAGVGGGHQGKITNVVAVPPNHHVDAVGSRHQPGQHLEGRPTGGAEVVLAAHQVAVDVQTVVVVNGNRGTSRCSVAGWCNPKGRAPGGWTRSNSRSSWC